MKIRNKDVLRTSYSRGIATTVGTVMVIIIFLTFFGIYLYMVDNSMKSNVKLNLESLEALRLKNTFSLFNKSLGTTWFVSTVQAVFTTVDESVGCGHNDIRLPINYWYKGRPDTGRDFLPKERLPQTDKYNTIGMNPQICYPRDEHIAQYIKDKLEQGGYLRLKETLDVSGVTIDRKEPAYNIFLNDNSIDSIFSQRIIAKTKSGIIDTGTRNNNVIETSLKRMGEAGRNAVNTLLVMGDNFYFTYASNPFNYQPRGVTPNIASYKERVSAAVEGAILSSNPYSDITSQINIKLVDVVASNDDTHSIVPSGHGLVVIYNATVRYIEGKTETQPQVLQWPSESKRVTSCYGYRPDPVDDIATFHGGMDVRASIDGIAEPVKAIADGTVVEINKDCPFTCSGYGNFVMIKHDNIYALYAHLSSVSVSLNDFVSAGQQIGVMGSTGRSTGVHLHLEIRKNTTAATRTDPCNYMDCSVSTELQCTAIYDTDKGKYYYYDKDTNTFEKRPIILEFGAEDYLPALNCISWANFTSLPVLEFNWETTNDIACCGGYLFACGVDIPNLKSDQTLQIGDQTSDDIPVQEICNGRLFGNTLSCTSQGFRTTSNILGQD